MAAGKGSGWPAPALAANRGRAAAALDGNVEHHQRARPLMGEQGMDGNVVTAFLFGAACGTLVIGIAAPLYFLGWSKVKQAIRDSWEGVFHD